MTTLYGFRSNKVRIHVVKLAYFLSIISHSYTKFFFAPNELKIWQDGLLFIPYKAPQTRNEICTYFLRTTSWKIWQQPTNGQNSWFSNKFLDSSKQNFVYAESHVDDLFACSCQVLLFLDGLLALVNSEYILGRMMRRISELTPTTFVTTCSSWLIRLSPFDRGNFLKLTIKVR